MRNLYISLLFIFLSHHINSQILINEYSCSNLSSYQDNFSEYEDWIELYNAGSSSVQLGGYFLSDDSLNLRKYQFPSGAQITAGGFLRLWASGRNKVSGGNYHTSFRLTQSGKNPDHIVLANSNGQILDFIHIQKNQNKHSRGRKPDGGSQWGIFTSPSPGSSNTSTQFPRYAVKPQMSLTPGNYTTKVTVFLSTTEPNSKIYYSINGSEPTTTSKLYNGTGIKIDSTKVLKAITVSNNGTILTSFIEINTYFFNVNHTLPVISISGTNLDKLANGDNSLRPEGSFEFFDLNLTRQAFTYGTFNSHGQDSWANDQRSLDFKSYDEMGYDYAIHQKLFSLSNRDEFQGVILRAAGDDNYPASHHASNAGSAHIRDAYIQNMAKMGGLNLDVRTAEKAIIYLNGKYWGVYDMRERCTESDYTDFYYNQDKYNLQYILTWGSTWAEYGGSQAISDWNSLTNFIMSKNMAIDSNYQYVDDRLDIASLIDYVIVNSVTVCSDWLNYNTGWWRGLNPDGGHKKWGYCLWDNDATFGFYINYTGVPDTSSSAKLCNVESSSLADPEGHIDILLKLCQNKKCAQYYRSRYIDLLNTVFSSANMVGQLDSTINLLKPEMTAHAKRWYGTYNEWMQNALKLRNYVVKRCSTMVTTVNSCYNTAGPYTKTFKVFPANAGELKINSLRIKQFPFTGKYFSKIDVLLKAIPNAEYEFDYWVIRKDTVKPDTLNPEIAIRIAGSDSIIAHFKKRTNQVTINISEIMYDNDKSFRDGSWIEIVNYGSQQIDLSKFNLFVDRIWKKFTFPAGFSLNAGERLVMISDSAAFFSHHTGNINYFLVNFNFQKNENIVLEDSLGTEYISIKISDKYPYPICTDASGRSMQLMHDSLSSSDPKNWRNGCLHGSPGMAFQNCQEFLTVSEINNKSSDMLNTDDWLELYNPGTQNIDLSGYIIRKSDFNIKYILPGGTQIPAQGYLVIAKDSANFFRYHPGLNQVVVIPNLSLNSESDLLKIYNVKDSLLYSIAWTDTGYFNQAASGSGYTLNYNDTGNDHSDGRNWFIACLSGSPNAKTVSCFQNLFFTEISYKSAPWLNSGDWLELYNASSTSVNLKGYTISDSASGGYTIPDNYILNSGQYVILCSDSTNFSAYYKNVSPVIYNVKFSLSAKGEKIRLWDSSGNLTCLIQYRDTMPWVSGFSEYGYTLDYANYNIPYYNPLAWKRSCYGGSPGEKITNCNDSLLITEINYNSHSSLPVGDWVELYNKSSSPVNLSGFFLIDAGIKDTFYFPNNTIIPARSYLVIASDSSSMRKYFGSDILITGNIKFGLSSNGDMIRLYNSNSRQINGFAYKYDSTWTTAGNGDYYTLELIKDSVINGLSRFWKNSCPGGTPGKSPGNCYTNFYVSEIMYNPGNTARGCDWFELSNPSDIPADLSNYTIYNFNKTNSFVFKPGTVLYKGKNLPIIQDSTLFTNTYPNIPFIKSGLVFNNISDMIRIYNPSGTEILSNSFQSALPWSQLASGVGYTLERKYPLTHPDSSYSWFAGCPAGSPGTNFSACSEKLIISEILYNPSVQYPLGKFVELKNNTNQPISLQNYKLGNYTISNQVSLNPGQFGIITSDSVSLLTYLPGTFIIAQNNTLMNGGSELYLYDSSNQLITGTAWSSSSPWPSVNGNGYTLERNDSLWDNYNSKAWFSGCYGGSAGTKYIPCQSKIIISEVNYNSHPEYNLPDYIEIYNSHNYPVPLIGLKMVVHNDTLIFSSPFNLTAQSLLIISSDSGSLRKYIPSASNVTQLEWSKLNLSSDDSVQIISPDKNSAFSYSPPLNSYFSKTNGHGFTYEKNLGTISGNNINDWFISCLGGSPGLLYTPCSYSLEISEIQVAPAPIQNSGSWIEIYNNGNVNQSLYDITLATMTDSVKLKYNPIIPPHQYVIVATDTVKFKNIFPTFLQYYSGIPISKSDSISLLLENRIVLNKAGFNLFDSNFWMADTRGLSIHYYNQKPFIKGPLGGSPASSDTSLSTSIQISEINYNSIHVMPPPGDYVELYNNSSDTLHLKNYTLYTSTSNYIIPEFNLLPGQYIVLSDDTVNLFYWWPKLFGKIIYLPSLKLANNEQIWITDPIGKIRWFSEYKNSNPYPTSPDGNGITLEYIPQTHDYFSFKTWNSGCFLGTPNQAFSLPCNNTGIDILSPKQVGLYPNPGQSYIYIQSSSPVVSISIFSASGEKIAEHNGISLQSLYVDNLASGIYFIKFQFSDHSYSMQKWIKSDD